MRRALLVLGTLAAFAATVDAGHARQCAEGEVAVDRNCSHPYDYTSTCTVWVGVSPLDYICVPR